MDDAARLIMDHGPGSGLAKVDMKSAYRIDPIHPEDRFLWE